MKIRLVLIPAALFLAFAGCTSSPQVASRFVKAVPVTAAEGATLTVSAMDSPELAGTMLTIPAGALPADTVITLELGDVPVVSSPSLPAGPVAVWGPPGTRFSRAVQLRLPYQLTEGSLAEGLRVEVLEDDGSRVVLTQPEVVVESDRLLRVEISGFSSYQAANLAQSTDAGPGCTSSQQCSVGEYCNQGSCVPFPCSTTQSCANLPGSVCINGQCKAPQPDAGPGCTNQQCRIGEYCSQGSCVPFPCSTTQSCANLPGSVCINGQCRPPQPDAGPGCTNNQQCGVGEYCNQASCVPFPCTTTQNCANYPGSVCLYGQCKPPLPDAGIRCTRTQECGIGEYCNQISCVPFPCTTTQNCANYPGSVCLNGECKPAPSVADAGVWCGSVQCTPNQSCLNGQCI